MKKALGGIGSFLQTPAGVIVMTTILWHGVILGLKIPFNYFVSAGLFFLDFILAFYLFDRLIYFFSQFILPIQNPKDREQIYQRVKIFETGMRGPTLFVKNGRVITHEGEENKRGPGVIVLDTASAVVLRTDTEIKGAVGPGIKFTDGEEYIAENIGVDLRAQWQFIGPLTSDQPFLNPTPISNPKLYNDLEKRRQQTAGWTRDGFEVCPTISIRFSIRRPTKKTPTESGVTSQYGFDANAVRHAVTREVIELGRTDNKQSRMEWSKIPAHLVVNLWREYVRKFKLEELFTSRGESGLQRIEDMINMRVRQAKVVVLDDTGAPTERWQDSLEYKHLLMRGLEVMEVRIHNVLFEPALEENLVKQWSAEWMRVAKKDEELLTDKEALIETAARDAAIKRFARTVSQKYETAEETQRDSFTILQDLIGPLRESILIESRANNDIEIQLKKLNDIWKWLLINHRDANKKQDQDQEKG